jgi:LuxR family quorum-sensing system transcriptional regulator CciR
MPLNRLIEEFERQARAARSGAELLCCTEAVALELGFSRLALVHALWFAKPGERLIRLDNFGEWGDIFIARGYYRNDPALLAAQRTNRPFAWTQFRHLLPPNRFCPRILSEAIRHGLRVGYTVPIGVMGEPAGCCSFATDAAELPAPHICRAAAWIASEAFAEARRLHGYPVPVEEAPPQLSPRRLECLHWAVIGRTDEQIAMIMGAKVTTIRTYMADLRRGFGVCSRTELARAAQRAGLIGLEDAIP